MQKDKQSIKVTIEEAENGIVCTVCHGGDMDHEDKKYIYPTIQKAAKSLPAIFSVGEAEAPAEDEKSLEKMKSKLPKED